MKDIESQKIRVCIVGAKGKMGTTVVQAISQCSDMVISSVVDRIGSGQSLQETAGLKAPNIKIQTDLENALKFTPHDVLIDFTHPESAAHHALLALTYKVSPIIGTSNLPKDHIEQIRMATVKYQTPAMIIPNFSIGVVLLMQFAQEAAKWFPNSEIIEMHHEQKLDAPSGTSLHLAQLISDARIKSPHKISGEIIKVSGARGANINNVPIHSIRLQGLIAHDTVIFGDTGGTLTLRHDSTNRTGFMEGLKIAIRQVKSLEGLIIGLESILFDSKQIVL